MRDNRPLIALLAAATVGAPACGLLFGRKVDLADKPLQALRIDLAEGVELCPGATAPLTVTAVLTDGTELATPGAGGGDVGWDNYRITWTGGAVESLPGGGRGLLAFPDPIANWRQPPTLTVASVHHPQIGATQPVALAYDCRYAARFAGAPGRDGRDGAFGGAGPHGRNEQTSPSYAKPGGHGSTGGRGGSGGAGEVGRRGDDVEVWAHLLEDTGRSYLAVFVQSTTSDRNARYLVDVTGAGQLTIDASGGAGGRGGNGGPGGSGGSGGTGVPPGRGGDGGSGGDGGDGADGGDGGRITLHAEPAAEPFIDRLVLVNRGGAGGPRGRKGPPGSGGNAHSGADAGRRGQWGQDGGRDGRDGRGGPQPEIRWENVERWATPRPGTS